MAELIQWIAANPQPVATTAVAIVGAIATQLVRSGRVKSERANKVKRAIEAGVWFAYETYVRARKAQQTTDDGLTPDEREAARTKALDAARRTLKNQRIDLDKEMTSLEQKAAIHDAVARAKAAGRLAKVGS